jgi:hypothetical protein
VSPSGCDTLAAVRSSYFVALFAVACVPNEPANKEQNQQKATSQVPSARPAKKAKPPTIRPIPEPKLPKADREAPPTTESARPGSADPLVRARFVDDFERPEPGDEWLLTGGGWKIDRGQLCAQGARNHPAWLKRRIPDNARIEFDATTYSDDGDIKAEIWGDGRSFAKANTYDHATSYLVIFGGWKNQFHVLARQDEHAKNRPEVRIDPDSDDPRARRVEPTQSYHFKVERDDGKTVRWYVDDLEILTYPDPAPLRGPGHDHFGLNDWDVRVCFDNLTINPL